MKDRNGHCHCDWDGASLPGANGPGPHFCSPECRADYYADLGQRVPARRCTRCKKVHDSLTYASCDTCRSYYQRVHFGGPPPALITLAPCPCGAPRDDLRSAKCGRCRDRTRRMRAIPRRVPA